MRLLRTVTCDRGPLHRSSNPSQDSLLRAWHWKALYDAAKSADKAAVEAVLGASSASIIFSGDEVEDKNTRDTFIERYEQMNRWAKEINGEQTLILGAENWPFPIPLKEDAAGTWYFDTKAGVKEILFRRIGRNELAAIRVCHALADAQHCCPN